MAIRTASGRKPGSNEGAHRAGEGLLTRLPTPGVHSASRARLVRPQHEPRHTCAPPRRGAAKSGRRSVKRRSRLTRRLVSWSCLSGVRRRAHNLTKWAQGVGQTGTPAKRKKLGCQGLQREFKYMNASLYLHVKRMYSTLVSFCRNPVSYLVQNAKIICTTLMQGNVPDQ